MQNRSTVTRSFSRDSVSFFGY